MVSRPTRLALLAKVANRGKKSYYDWWTHVFLSVSFQWHPVVASFAGFHPFMLLSESTWLKLSLLFYSVPD